MAPKHFHPPAWIDDPGRTAARDAFAAAVETACEGPPANFLTFAGAYAADVRHLRGRWPRDATRIVSIDRHWDAAAHGPSDELSYESYVGTLDRLAREGNAFPLVSRLTDRGVRVENAAFGRPVVLPPCDAINFDLTHPWTREDTLGQLAGTIDRRSTARAVFLVTLSAQRRGRAGANEWREAQQRLLDICQSPMAMGDGLSHSGMVSFTVRKVVR